MVTLPAGLDPNTKVRCPFTKEEFLVSEILDNLPPMLEVVDGPSTGGSSIFDDAAAPALGGAGIGVLDVEGSPGADKSSDDTAVAHDVAVKEEERETATEDAMPTFGAGVDAVKPSDGAFDFGGVGSSETAASATSGAAVGAKPRPKRKQKNMAVEVVKIVLGGIAGLAIATLIMWWGMGRDPFNLAPKLNKLPGFISFVAPASLREADQETEDDNGEPVSDADDPSKGSGGRKQKENEEDKSDLSKRDQEVIDTPFGKPGGMEQEPKSDDGPDQGPEDKDEPKKRTDQPPPRETTAGVLDAPVYSGPELGKALKEADEAMQVVVNAGGLDLSDEARKEEAVAFYRAFCRLGEKITFVDPQGQQVPDRVNAAKTMLADLGRSSENFDTVGRIASVWLDPETTRSTDGILLAGRVTQIKVEARGRLFNTRMVLAGDSKEIVYVFSTQNPLDHDDYDKGSHVFLLGTIIEEPSLKIKGYEGTQQRVIWHGQSVAVE